MKQHTLKVGDKEYLIKPCSQFWGFSKVGELTNIKRTDINRLIGFSGNQYHQGRCNGKQTKTWCFELTLPNGETHLCLIWDYYSTGQWYSVWMPEEFAKDIFGDRFEAQNYAVYKQISHAFWG